MMILIFISQGLITQSNTGFDFRCGDDDDDCYGDDDDEDDNDDEDDIDDIGDNPLPGS